MSQTAMTRSITHTTADGFATVQIQNEALTITLIPELGGKISSLRDRRSGREWLWRHPRMAYQRVAHGATYTTVADTGGWDECFPTVAPCAYPAPPWHGAALQDHGELWSQPADLHIDEAAESITVHTGWQGVALPYVFQRSITIGDAAMLRFSYAATNHSDDALHAIWSAHPLLAIEPGMRLEIPASARFNRWAAVPPDLLAKDRGIAYPLTARVGERMIDLTALPDSSAAIALKLWSDPLPPGAGWATLHARDGALRMRWDTARLPQIAFWMNLGAWAGDGGTPYYNLGLEPCIGAQDSLADAFADHRLTMALPPHGTIRWEMEVELTT